MEFYYFIDVHEIFHLAKERETFDETLVWDYFRMEETGMDSTRKKFYSQLSDRFANDPAVPIIIKKKGKDVQEVTTGMPIKYRKDKIVDLESKYCRFDYDPPAMCVSKPDIIYATFGEHTYPKIISKKKASKILHEFIVSCGGLEQYKERVKKMVEFCENKKQEYNQEKFERLKELGQIQEREKQKENDYQESEQYLYGILEQSSISKQEDSDFASQESLQMVLKDYIQARITDLTSTTQPHIRKKKITLLRTFLHQYAELCKSYENYLPSFLLDLGGNMDIILEEKVDGSETYLQFVEDMKDNSILRIINLQCVDGKNIKTRFIDFSGTNIALVPSLTYGNSVQGCNFTDVTFSPFSNSFIGTDISSAIITDPLIEIDLDTIGGLDEHTRMMACKYHGISFKGKDCLKNAMTMMMSQNKLDEEEPQELAHKSK